MSVLIRDMEMPKNCAECRFCVNGFTDKAPVYECACESYENVSVLVDDYGKPFDFRPDWCPLIEVKTPYGRLIDADALLSDDEIVQILTGNPQRTGKLIKEFAELFADKVNRQPTIIEADAEDAIPQLRIRQLAGQAGKILVDAALNAIKESEGSEDEQER